jgi:hypothetical protein
MADERLGAAEADGELTALRQRRVVSKDTIWVEGCSGWPSRVVRR